MIKVRCSSSRWTDTKAWMVDYTGLAVPIENHVQKGEPIANQLDEYGIACAIRYADLANNTEYKQAAEILAWNDFLDNLTADSINDLIDVEEELSLLLESENVPLYLKVMKLPKLQLTVKELLDIYTSRNYGKKTEAAERSIHTLFERLMMRVRVGGVINTPSTGTTDIYFRIPDSRANGWYSAIGNFLYDHPQYVGFTLHVYEEADTAAQRRELESYTDGKEFLDLHASRKSESYAARRIESAYRHRNSPVRRFFFKSYYSRFI